MNFNLFDILINSVETLFLIFLIIFTNYIFNKLSCKDCPRWCYSISTIIHELSHLIIAKIFFLKVSNVHLFKMNGGEELGSVDVCYDENRLKDMLGMFLSGIAPLVSITSIMYFVLFLINPSMMELLKNEAEHFNFISIALLFLNPFKFGFLKWILFVVIAFFVTSGMYLSNDDIIYAVDAGWLAIIFFAIVFNVFNIGINHFLLIVLAFTISIYILNLISSWLIFTILPV